MHLEKLTKIIETQPDLSPEAEKQKRPERLAYLKERVQELFPDPELSALKTEIIDSLAVPQFGEYHKEGMLMDSHIIRILQNLEDIKKGQFLPGIPEEIQARLCAIVTAYTEDFGRYAFLHDLAKKDCLTIKYAEHTEEVTWEEYCQKFPLAERQDPVLLKDRFTAAGVTGIGYYQAAKKRKHGICAAASLRERFPGKIPEILLTAISNHEAAFEFKVDKTLPLKSYADIFGKMSVTEIIWVLTASYIDTAAALRENGQPDLTNFQVMLDTMYNYQTLQALEAVILPKGKEASGLERKKVEAFLIALRSANQKFSKTAAQLITEAQESCRPSRYNLELFKAALIESELDDNLIAKLLLALKPDGILDAAVYGRVKAEALRTVDKEQGRIISNKISAALTTAEQ